MNRRARPRHVAEHEPLELDYLGSRGYPLSMHNRRVVLQLIRSMEGAPARQALFRYLDDRLLPRRK